MTMSTFRNLTLCTTLLVACSTQASVVITAVESEGDVVFSGEGTINLAGLDFHNGAYGDHHIAPFRSSILLGPSLLSKSLAESYKSDTFTGPTSFGSGDTSIADSSTGSSVGIYYAAQSFRVVVPDGYQSNDPLSGSITFNDTTLQSLGVTPGTYTWTWGSGASEDFLKLVVVPEPASLALMAVGTLALWPRRWTR